MNMLPDGRKLLRKRTVTHPADAPIPVHVPVNENMPDNIPNGKGYRPGDYDTLGPPLVKEVSTLKKSSRRLSKRR